MSHQKAVITAVYLGHRRLLLNMFVTDTVPVLMQQQQLPAVVPEAQVERNGGVATGFHCGNEG